MKIFISSVISGMEDYRLAAKEAIQQLGHEAVMAEDFQARPHSPQIACLEGLRKSGLVVLLLGQEYGVKQISGISPTHEEYHDAKGQRPILAYVVTDQKPGNDQAGFIKEVQGWEAGLFRGLALSPEKLKTDLTTAIHHWELSNAAGPLKHDELKEKAVKLVNEENQNNRYHNSAAVLVSIVGGPDHALLRPSEIEKPELNKDLLQAALFNTPAIFSTGDGNNSRIENGCLIIEQDKGKQSITLATDGGMLFRLQVQQEKHGMVVIKEKLEKQMVAAFKYASWLLDKIDPTQKITHISIAVNIVDLDYMVLRTQAEHDASPNSYSLGVGQRNKSPITLQPAHRPRASLAYEADVLSEDFATLIKRNSSNTDY